MGTNVFKISTIYWINPRCVKFNCYSFPLLVTNDGQNNEAKPASPRVLGLSTSGCYGVNPIFYSKGSLTK